MTARTRTYPTAHRIAALGAGIVLTLGIGACTSDDPDTDGSSSDASSGASSSASSGAGDEDAPGTDQSAELFESYSDPTPVGKSTDGDRTLEVFEVRSTANGTRLAFHISSPEGGQADLDPRSWSEFPELVDRSGKTGYQPLTVTRPEYENEDEQLLCVCTGQGIVHSNARMQHVLYEPLPEDVTSVDVSFGDFDPVTVKVAR